MKNEKSFISKANCTIIAKKLTEWAELGGYECYNNDSFLSAAKCRNAAEQFKIHRDKNDGNYFANIIFAPFFSVAEIEAILNLA